MVRRVDVTCGGREGYRHRMVLTLPLFSKPLRIVPGAPTTTELTVTPTFYSFYSFLVRYKYLFIVYFSFIFTPWSAGTARFTTRLLLLLLLLLLDQLLYYTLFPTSCNSKKCPWCNGYRRRKWTRRYEFKFRTRLIAFHIALIPLGKVWIQLFSLQLWVNSRTD